MSIEFSNGTSSIVVSYYKDKGTPNVETITIPATGEYGSHTITVPATAGATQADYFLVTSVLAGKSAAVWLDIDAAGTTPTGIFYGNVEYQIETNIITGGTAIQNAALVKSAIEGEVGMTGITVTDNGDGTLTIDQDVVGWAGDLIAKNADDSGDGSVIVATVNEGLAGITQGDYVVLQNAYGAPVAVWFDVDDDGTSPSGAAFIAAAGDGETLEIDVATGDTNVENAANVFAALSALAWANPLALTDNLDGTLTLASGVDGVVAAADPHNIDDTGVGSVTSTVSTVGTAKELEQQIDFVKGDVHVLANKRLNAIVFNTYGDSVGEKGKSSTIFHYDEVALPSSTDVFNLASQIKAWNVSESTVQLVSATGFSVSLQPSPIGVIDISTADFSLASDRPFLIKNDGTDAVELTVVGAGSTTPVTTKFKVGWNEDLVISVAEDALISDLVYGY